MPPRNWLLLPHMVVLVCVAGTFEGRVASAQEPLVSIPVSLRAPGEDGEETAENRHLRDFLVGTRWLMYEIPGRIVEFGENGRFDLDDWKNQGIEARWKATGPHQVIVTVVSQKFHNLTATLNFDDRLSYFTGTDLDPKRRITKSPRIHHVPNDPADPYHR